MYIIAEIGFNHEGDMKLAVQMIEAAAQAGANAVKFQTYRAIDLALPSAPHYQSIRCGEMSLEQHQELATVACDFGVDFLSTPYSPWAVDLLERIDVPAYKVASMDCTNTHLLQLIAATQKPVYLSTGMATLAEIANSLDFLRRNDSGQVTLLHCMSLYPANAEDLHLDIIPLLKKMFGIPVGYSDHYPGVQACFVAAILGADVLETHFTLDVSKSGGDHSHSADPKMLKQLVADIELAKSMIGVKRAIYNRPDCRWAKKFRRGVYAAKQLYQDEHLRVENLLFCRPTSRFSPNDVTWLTEKILSRNVSPYQPIEPDMLKN
jgi:sialic acid synthase SpsE